MKHRIPWHPALAFLLGTMGWLCVSGFITPNTSAMVETPKLRSNNPNPSSMGVVKYRLARPHGRARAPRANCRRCSSAYPNHMAYPFDNAARTRGLHKWAKSDIEISGQQPPVDKPIPEYKPKPLSPKDQYKLRLHKALMERLNEPNYQDGASSDNYDSEAEKPSPEKPNDVKKKEEKKKEPAEEVGGFKMIIIDRQGNQKIIRSNY